MNLNENPATLRPHQPQQNPAFDPWLLWVAFRSHWGWVVPAGTMFAALFGLVVWYKFVPVYEATYLMEANRDYVLSQSMSTNARDLAKSERQLITHAIVLSPVLANPALKAAFSATDPLQPERQIRNNLKIGNAGTDNLLTISYQHNDPDMARDVCNAIAEAYLEVRRDRDDDRMANIEKWLQGPIESWKRNVESLRQNISDLTKSANGYDPFKESSSIESDSSKLIQVRNVLAGLEAEEAVLEARLQIFNAQVADADGVPVTKPDALELQKYVDIDPEVEDLQQKLDDLETKIRSMEFREQQNLYASRYKTLKQEAAEAEAKLKVAVAEATQSAEVTLAELARQRSAAKHESEIQAINFDLINLRAKRLAFQEDYEEEKSRLEKLGGETAEIFFAQEDYAQAQEILQQLNERLAIMKTERGRGAGVTTMAAASRPAWPVEEIPLKKIGMASAAGFFIPFALAVFLEFRLKRITSAKSLESNELAPVVGEIARVPGGSKSTRGHRLFEESVDALRANLLFKLDGVRTIVVTSAMSAEGKSSVASQLAISLAKASETTVLLIDADLRSPDQHDLFGLEIGPGLCKLLAGKATLDESIDTSLGDFVHVLPAGRLDANPHNLLTKKNVERLFEQVVGRYRYIVIDTAPVLPAPESMAVASAGDVTLLCAMRDVSRTDHVTRTHRRLAAAGANIIGTVFSGVPSHEYAYRYGDYRYTAKIE